MAFREVAKTKYLSKKKLSPGAITPLIIKNQFKNRKGRVALKHLSMMVKVIN
jgi:hypothetical protein